MGAFNCPQATGKTNPQKQFPDSRPANQPEPGKTGIRQYSYNFAKQPKKQRFSAFSASVHISTRTFSLLSPNTSR
jgi:hypothetical protein